MEQQCPTHERTGRYCLHRTSRYRRTDGLVQYQGFPTLMTTNSFSPDDVAHFLKEHPGFFQEHAELFSNLRVPHPNETRAISLGERQIMTLRARTKDLEWKLSGLVSNANGNEKISKTLMQWCCRMLARTTPCRYRRTS